MSTKRSHDKNSVMDQKAYLLSNDHMNIFQNDFNSSQTMQKPDNSQFNTLASERNDDRIYLKARKPRTRQLTPKSFEYKESELPRLPSKDALHKPDYQTQPLSTHSKAEYTKSYMQDKEI